MIPNSNDPIKAALLECRPLFFGALLFSLIVNLLSLAVPIYSMQILDRVMSSGSMSTLVMLTIIVIALVIFSGLITGLRSVVFFQISRWLDDKISKQLVQKTIDISLLRPNIGAQPIRDLSTVRSFISSPTMANILDAPWAVIFFVVLYILNITIGVVITIAALVLLGLAVWSQKGPAALTESSADSYIKSMQMLESVIRNSEVVRAMGMVASATRLWQIQNEKALDDGYRAGNMGTIISNATKSFRMGLQILITALGAWLAIHNQISIGAIIAVNMLSGKALAPFDAAVSIYQGLTHALKAHKRLITVFESNDPSIERLELPDPKGAISFKNVTYQDQRSKRWLLKGLTLNFPAGSLVGIIGPSGSGKTTLSRLLVGVQRPTNGVITLDNASFDQWQTNQLSSYFGYLPQDIELFTGTVAQNIARMEGNASDQEIIKAAKLAEIHDFVLTLPDGYQTDIGENGAALSAGQRQRIALARCFYGNPKVIVLDEPNSNLDTEGEQALVQSLVNSREKGITTLIVSHRPALLHHVDQIIVLKAGEVALQGPAKEVMEKLAGANKSVKPLKIDRAG